MIHTVSIDPGVNEIGIAAWSGTELAGAALIKKNGDWLSLVRDATSWVLDWAMDVNIVVIEKPQVYRQHLLKGDPNDLISLAVVVGAIANDFKREWPSVHVELLLPREWKGQTPKKVSVERTQRALTAAETRRVELPKTKSLHHNVWDSVGIGLHWVRGK
ncbi:hypothetical protein LCGC14_0630780 [marine sediment metagenome]|uniref:YqgF/RNase H-like domain-containing protein n=1 Tax=marine sediment metagenome TaxID=412755 RepID=A0A0F9TNG3_9ZZZZ